MVDVTIKVITPATQFAFLTLAEAKAALGIVTSDATSDAQLQWLIDTNSAVIATLCNRTFAKEKVRETWRCLLPNRMFLTHWPVKEADIETLTVGGTPLVVGDWEVEEESGKLLLPAGSPGPIVITYTGGYDLPTQAPMALKQATSMLVAVTRADAAAVETSGIRMIAHKEKRIMFHPPSSSSSSGTGGGTAPGARTAVKNILDHFMRHWI
jgi:hypothetical protein